MSQAKSVTWLGALLECFFSFLSETPCTVAKYGLVANMDEYMTIIRIRFLIANVKLFLLMP
jgi:hypothetical protein